MNPFQQTMVKMQLGEDMGTSISVAGFTMEAEADRTIEVPKQLVETMRAHGLTLPVKPAAVAKK